MREKWGRLDDLEARAAAKPPPPFLAADPADITIDISPDAHFLDHPVWHCMLGCEAGACHVSYGGWRAHLRFGWQFRWRDEIGRLVLCVPLRRHAYTGTWNRAGYQGLRCRRCWKAPRGRES